MWKTKNWRKSHINRETEKENIYNELWKYYEYRKVYDYFGLRTKCTHTHTHIHIHTMAEYEREYREHFPKNQKSLAYKTVSIELVSVWPLNNSKCASSGRISACSWRNFETSNMIIELNTEIPLKLTEGSVGQRGETITPIPRTFDHNFYSIPLRVEVSNDVSISIRQIQESVWCICNGRTFIQRSLRPIFQSFFICQFTTQKNTNTYIRWTMERKERKELWQIQ